jgi:hypothetical protein
MRPHPECLITAFWPNVVAIDLAAADLNQSELILAVSTELVGDAAPLPGTFFYPCGRSRSWWLYLRFRQIYGLRCESWDKLGGGGGVPGGL